YAVCAQVHGVRPIETPLLEDLGFDLRAMLREVRKNARVKMVFIANPNNPTGQYLPTQECLDFIRKIGKIRGRKIMVVLDYAYWEYILANDLPDVRALIEEYPYVVVLRTF